MGERVTRIILDTRADLVEQARVAAFCLSKDCPPGPGGWAIITAGKNHYGVRWNKGSLRVYPPSAGDSP